MVWAQVRASGPEDISLLGKEKRKSDSHKFKKTNISSVKKKTKKNWQFLFILLFNYYYINLKKDQHQIIHCKKCFFFLTQTFANQE